MSGRRSFVWQRARLAAEVQAAMARGESVEIELPADTHYALTAALLMRPGEISGGPELLRTMARVRSLAELSQFEDAVRAAGYEVSLSSPPPLLSLTPASATWRQPGVTARPSSAFTVTLSGR